MKTNLLTILAAAILASTIPTQLSAQSIESMNLRFVMPDGFSREQKGEFDKGAALGGVKIRLVSLKKDVLIAITLLEQDTTAKGEADLQFIRDKFNPTHQRNQNFYSYARSLADSVSSPILKMSTEELKYYNSDYGVSFTIKDSENPYLKDFPVGKGKTMFKWRRGDVFVWYFFKSNVSQEEQQHIIAKTKGIVKYK